MEARGDLIPLRQGLSMKLKLTGSTRLANQGTPRIYPSLAPGAERFYVDPAISGSFFVIVVFIVYCWFGARDS